MALQLKLCACPVHNSPFEVVKFGVGQIAYAMHGGNVTVAFAVWQHHLTECRLLCRSCLWARFIKDEQFTAWPRRGVCELMQVCVSHDHNRITELSTQMIFGNLLSSLMKLAV